MLLELDELSEESLEKVCTFCGFSSLDDKVTAACPLIVEGIVPERGKMEGGGTPRSAAGKGLGPTGRALDTGLSAACVGCLFIKAT